LVCLNRLELPELGSILQKYSKNVKSISCLLALSQLKTQRKLGFDCPGDRFKEIEKIKQAIHFSVKSLLNQNWLATWQSQLKYSLNPNFFC
jgi:hypothetical protein